MRTPTEEKKKEFLKLIEQVALENHVNLDTFILNGKLNVVGFIHYLESHGFVSLSSRTE